MNGLGILGPELRADDVGDLVDQRFVEGGRHSDCLRGYGCFTGACYPVQTLVPPVVFRNAQSRDCGRGMPELRDLFLESHARNQIVNAPVDRQVGFVYAGEACCADASGHRAEQRNKQASTLIFIVTSLIQEVNFPQAARKHRGEHTSLTYTAKARITAKV